jgi:hypothetical protein
VKSATNSCSVATASLWQPVLTIGCPRQGIVNLTCGYDAQRNILPDFTGGVQ